MKSNQKRIHTYHLSDCHCLVRVFSLFADGPFETLNYQQKQKKNENMKQYK